MFQQRVKQGFIVQDQIARLLIGQQLDQALMIASLGVQSGNNEVNVFRSELDPTVRLNHFHTNNAIASIGVILTHYWTQHPRFQLCGN